MADRPSIKDILAAARKDGPATPSDEPGSPVSQSAREAGDDPTGPDEPLEVSSAPEPAADAPTPASLGRPLTMAEKLAAARAGGAPKLAAAAPPKPKPAAKAAPAVAAEAESAPVAAAEVPTAASLGRPLTMAEKLAAARAGGGTKPAASGAAKPAAAKAAPSAKAAVSERTLPPLEKMSDPKDLAEAARRAGASKAKAAEPAGKPAKAAKKAEVQVVPPKPGKAASTEGQPGRRQVLRIPWLAIGWGSFAAGMGALTAACGRFMFPNVLAEPPSTIKVGLPSNFEPEEVNESWKAEWGFWLVRSSKVDGQDVIYALQSVCTHLGCPPNWLPGEQKFKCPCHGSGFYITGVNFEGPAPRPLERFKVVIADDGQVMIDKSQKFQEEMGQWSDPDSYIPV